MKKIFLMIFLSTISFSSLYQRFNSGQEYKQEILKTDNVNERTFGFYLNADLLNKKEREQEKENIIKSFPSISSFFERLYNLNNPKLYNIKEIIDIFNQVNDNKLFNESLLIEICIEKGYINDLKKIYKGIDKDTYIYKRLTNNYDEILKYGMNKDKNYHILLNMFVQYLTKAYDKSNNEVENMDNFLSFTEKYVDLLQTQDKRMIFKIMVSLEETCYVLKSMDVEFGNKFFYRVDRIVNKLINEKDIKLINEDSKKRDFEFIKTWREK